MSARALRVVPDQPDDAPDFDMPRDDDAERATLGAVILGLNPEILEEIRDLVEPDDFYRPAHETIFQTLCELADTGRPRDALALANALGPELARVGGSAYLHSLMEAVPTAANGPYYAQLVKDKAYSRRMVVVGTRLAQMGRTELEPDLIAAAEREVMTLFKREVRGWPEPVALTRIRAVPQFPVYSLTGWTRAKVEAVAHETQTPVDLAATLALACLSTAAGGKVRVMVRPEVRWSEPVNLYPELPLKPGITANQAKLQGTTALNPAMPLVNSADFYVPTIAPGTDGVPACTVSSTGAQLCDNSETIFGNTARNLFRSPFQRQVDLSIIKNTRINEHFTLRFQADAFNVSNTPSFDAPNNNLSLYSVSKGVPSIKSIASQTTFGVIQNTIGSPRFMQMSMSLVF